MREKRLQRHIRGSRFYDPQRLDRPIREGKSRNVIALTSFFLALLSSDMFAYLSDSNFFNLRSGFMFATRFMKRPCEMTAS